MFFRRLAFVAFFAVCLASKDLKKHCKVYDGASFNEMFVRCVIENQRFEEIKEKCGEVLDRKGRCEVPLEPVKAGFVKDSDVYFVAEEENGCLENPEAKDFEVFVENEDAKECGRVVAKNGTLFATNELRPPTNVFICECGTFDFRKKRDAPAPPAVSIAPPPAPVTTNRHVTMKRLKEGATLPPGATLAPGVRPALTTVAVPTTTTKGTVEIGLSFSLVLGTCLALI